MNVFWTIFLSSTIPTAIVTGMLFVFRTWIAKKIQYEIKHGYDLRMQEIKHEYDKRLIDIKNEYEKRTRATLIAELLAEWISWPKNLKKLNKLTFEAFLWLPADIAKKLSLRLNNNPKSPDIREIIFDVRKLLLETEDALLPKEIIVFTKKNKGKKAE